MSSMFIRISNKAWIVQKYKKKQNDVNVAKFNSEDKPKYKSIKMQKEKHIYYIFENWELKQDNAHIFISLSLALEPFSLLPVSLLDCNSVSFSLDPSNR